MHDKGNTSHYYDDTINASSVCTCMHVNVNGGIQVSIQVSIQ